MISSLGSKPSSPSPLPEWYNTYFAALLESDEKMAFHRLERAAKAIEDRMICLRSGAPEGERETETQDLTSALTYLRLLQENINQLPVFYGTKAGLNQSGS